MSLIERLQDTTDATFWPGKIPMNYVYTAGRAGDVFFKRLRDKGTFIGARCEMCDTVYLPPRIFCERCFERIEGKWVNLKNRGVVHTFTVCHETFKEEPKKPSIVAFVKLEGADGGLFHRLDADPEDVYIGMPVEAVLQPAKKRKGGILDIKCFKPRK
jgi:hypothetical protein